MTAAILIGVWVLWPIVATAGGLGFAPLTGVAALLLFPLVAPKLRPRTYLLFLFGFLAYAGLTTLWSPEPSPLVEIDFAKGDFGMRKEVKAALALLAAGVLLAATRSLDEKGRALVLRVARIAMLVQLGLVAFLCVFEEQVIDFLAQWIPDQSEGVQNITRNSLMMAAAAPFLVPGLIENRSPLWAVLIALGVLALEVALLFFRGVNGGLVALMAAAFSIGVVAVWRRNGFRILACIIALIVWTAPMFFGFLSLNADVTAVTTPDSSEQRLGIWRRVVQLTADHPIEGSGIGVLRTIRETIPEGYFKGQLLVPNHAHNMMLQLWAETGAIGAFLLAAAILLAGWRLPEPERLGLAAPRVAGLAGVMTAIAAVSFDLWSEWWWAFGGLLAVLASVLVAQPATLVTRTIPRALLAYRPPPAPASSLPTS